jgi:hypothetical protein
MSRTIVAKGFMFTGDIGIGAGLVKDESGGGRGRAAQKLLTRMIREEGVGVRGA